MKRIQRILSLVMISGLITVTGQDITAQQGQENADKAKGKEKKEVKGADQKPKPGGSGVHQRDTARMHPDGPKGGRGNGEMKGRPYGERPEPGKGGPGHGMPKDSLKRHEMEKGRPGGESETETETETGKEREPVKGKEIEKDQQGHAYGKNKGELEGREFGQARAEQARMEQHKKEYELGASVMESEAKVKESREKIAAAKEKLENDKKAKKISDVEYKEKKEKIDKAERAVDNLEMQVKKAKEMKEK